MRNRTINISCSHIFIVFLFVECALILLADHISIASFRSFYALPIEPKTNCHIYVVRQPKWTKWKCLWFFMIKYDYNFNGLNWGVRFAFCHSRLFSVLFCFFFSFTISLGLSLLCSEIRTRQQYFWLTKIT